MDKATFLRRLGRGCLTGTLAALFASGLAVAKAPDAPKADSEETLKAGRELFTRLWTPGDSRSHGGDGLGPVFNAQSCLGCHDQGGPGGAGSIERNIEIATATGLSGYNFAYSFRMDFGAGTFEYRIGNPAQSTRREPALDRNFLATIHPGFKTARSVVLHRFGVDPQYERWRQAVPGAHGNVAVQIALRNPTPLFGTGLIDAIPDEVIEAAAKRKPASSRTKGRVSRPKGGGIGRFGWKAQTATLEEFVRSAAATEMGLELPTHRQAADPRLPGLGAAGPDMNDDECDALVAFVRSLEAPVTADAGDAKEALQVKAGEATFKSIGCAECHLPKLGEVEGVYSDLLLHDMGPQLGDTGDYGVFVASPAGAAGAGARDEPAGATPQEWRTPPLWGLRDSGPYLHDGRAGTIDEAIRLHGGQGSTSAHRYSQLTARRKQQLEAFLTSLAAPPQQKKRPEIAKAP
jgi:CxxC motif-containing protein (DUF1111 family)